MSGVKQVENRVDELEKRFEAMQAEFQKCDMEKLQNDIPAIKESMGAILTKIDSYNPETTARSTPAIENPQQRPNQSRAMLESLPRQLELPVFEGENPEGWLFRAERYFELNNMSSAEKLRSAVVCLEGDALSWYYYEEGRRPFRSWEEFKLQLLERLQLTQVGALHDQLFSLQQTTTVCEYRRQFEVLFVPLKELPESVLESVFRKRLQPDVRAELRLMEPLGLSKMMRTAQQIEDKNAVIRNFQGGSILSKGQAVQKPSSPIGTNFRSLADFHIHED